MADLFQIRETMKNTFIQSEAGRLPGQLTSKTRVRTWIGSAIAVAILACAFFVAPRFVAPSAAHAAAAAPLPVVAVSVPLQHDLEERLQFLGQFSAVEQVELRAQVGGTLTHIGFKDGEIVKAGDLLFTIDPTPYQIKLSQAMAQVEKARPQVEKAQA
jgi:membrane fusion protein, multidrug efflux system